MTKTETVKNYCKQLNLAYLSNHIETIIMEAENQKISYQELISELMVKEINYRQLKDKERRLKLADLPLNSYLERYDLSAINGLEQQQFRQLRELNWLEQNYNIILMGPSGIGKTYIAAGLCRDAVEHGYKAYFRNMEDLVQILKLKNITRKAAIEYKRIEKAHLLVIDDIMMFPVNEQEINAFFHLINELHEKASVIITTNKSPKQWIEIIKDEIITTALLDRLLYRCEIIKLVGESYRLKNRETIFNKL